MQKQKRVVMLSLIILAVMAMVLTTGRTQNKITPATNEEATHIQEGVMTEKQKKHSKLYKNRGVGRKLTEIARKEGSAKIIVELPMPAFNPDSPTPTSSQYLRELACKSDAIVIGKVESKASQLTQEEDFVFTDYDLSIEEVIKDNSAQRIGTNTNIAVTRPGGVVELNGQIIRADLAAYRPLEVGKRYITFLSYIPETNSYTAINSTGSFLLENDKVIKLTEGRLIKDLENKDAQSFISELRGVVELSCDSPGKGAKR